MGITEVLDINISGVIALELVVVEGCIGIMTSVGATGRVASCKKRIVNEYSSLSN